MMYYPYLRGRMYDLLALKELADRITTTRLICPIIEPAALGTSTVKSYRYFVKAAMPFIFITNPQCTDKIKTSDVYNKIIEPFLMDCDTFCPALIITPATRAESIRTFSNRFGDHKKCIIYGHGTIDHRLCDTILDTTTIDRHIFLDDGSNKAYRNALDRNGKILIKDVFHKKPKNSLYDPENFFSDAYLSFPNKDYAGFGDYSIVGKEFSESGGPAYAVAIHHVYVNKENENNLHIKHYLSDRTETPKDPSGKFIEALRKLVADIPKLGKLNDTDTVKEYLELYSEGKSPGLPTAKKLGIKHHLEIILNHYSTDY